MPQPTLPLLAQPPLGAVILAKPVKELFACISHKKMPSLELIIRVIKTLVLAIFRGHLHDRVCISNGQKILISYKGKVLALTCEELQKKFPYMLEKARLLVLTDPTYLPANFAINDKLAYRIEASTVGNFLFNRPGFKIRDLLFSPEFDRSNYRSIMQDLPTESDVVRKLYFILKEGSPEEFISLKEKYSEEHPVWFDANVVFRRATKCKNVSMARHLAKNEVLDHRQGEVLHATPLQNALALGDLETIHILLEKGATKNSLDGMGHNMMHYAARSGKIEIVKLVSSWDYLEGYERSYRHVSVPEAFWAAKSGNLECLKYMLDNPPSTLPLEMSVQPASVLLHPNSSTRIIVKPFSSNGETDPLKHTSESGSILHYAVKKRNAKEVVEYLVLVRSVNPLTQNSSNEYPIHIAASKGDLETVDYLWPLCKARGMKIDDFPEHGTLLHRAIEAGNLDLVKYLVREGASLKIKNCYSQNAIDIVKDSEYPHWEIREYILNHNP